MGKGGGGPSSQTVTQTNLPEYAEPYVKDLFERAATESTRPYQAYTGQRIANPDQLSNKAINIAQSWNATPDALQDGMRTTRAANNAAQGIGALGPTQFQANLPTLQGGGPDPNQYNFSDVDQFNRQAAEQAVGSDLLDFQGGPAASAYNFQDVQQFSPQSAQDYMTPYMQSVVDTEKQQAQLDFDRQQAGRDAQAVQAGAFGGSRSAVADALAQEGLNRDLQSIQASGQQSAYEDAQRMFQADRQARMQREAERAAEQGRVQDLGFRQAGLGAQTQLDARRLGADIFGADRQAQFAQEQAEQGEQARYDQALQQGYQYDRQQRLAEESARADEMFRAQQANDQSRLAFGELGLGAADLRGRLGAQLSDQALAQRDAGMQYVDMLNQLGQQRQSTNQARLDTAYQDFLTQQQYGQDQLAALSDIIRGNTRGSSTSQMQFQQSNPYQQLLGAGITGLSLAKQFGG